MMAPKMSRKERKRNRMMVVREIARRIVWQMDGRGRQMPNSVISVLYTTEHTSHPMRLFKEARRMAHNQTPRVRKWIRDRLKRNRDTISFERLIF